MPDKLPEEFAPTGPKLSRFPIRPAPPVRPHLFPDEARFALRLAVMAGATELATWALLAVAGRQKAILLLAALRLLRPVWSWLGTRVSRPVVASSLLGAALLACLAPPQFFWLSGLPALGDLCASCIGDSVTIERRSAALSWLEMGQALGAALGVAVAVAYPEAVTAVAAAALALAFAGVRDLHDRGTPRSTWPLSAYRLRSPVAIHIVLPAYLCGLFIAPLHHAGRALGFLAPLAGMAVVARLEPLMRNAVWLPRIAVALTFASKVYPPLRPLAAGVAFGAIPASVARGAGEMERPVVSSLAWSALILGAAFGAVI